LSTFSSRIASILKKAQFFFFFPSSLLLENCAFHLRYPQDFSTVSTVFHKINSESFPNLCVILCVFVK